VLARNGWRIDKRDRDPGVPGRLGELGIAQIGLIRSALNCLSGWQLMNPRPHLPGPRKEMLTDGSPIEGGLFTNL